MKIYIVLTIAIAISTFNKNKSVIDWLLFVIAWPVIVAVEFYLRDTSK